MYEWNTSEYNRSIAKELQSFLPSRIFDVHAHPGRKSDFDTKRTGILKELPEDVGINAWRDFSSLLVSKERLYGGLFFSLPLFPERCDLRQAALNANEYIVNELKISVEEKSRISLLVSSLLETSDIEPYFKNNAIVGFKPYAALCPGCGPNSRIPEYLPEWALRIADERGLAVTLHIQKHASLNDPDNIKDIINICKTYPKMKLILAHCGCSFNVYNALDGAKHYVDIDNLYFDTSAVCEGMALVHMLRIFPARKFMWGTDFPVSVRQGRFVGLGDYVYSLQNNTVTGGKLPDSINTLHHGLESLRALVYSIKECGLKDADIEGIFFGNAAELFNIN